MDTMNIIPPIHMHGYTRIYLSPDGLSNIYTMNGIKEIIKFHIYLGECDGVTVLTKMLPVLCDSPVVKYHTTADSALTSHTLYNCTSAPNYGEWKGHSEPWKDGIAM